MKRIHSGYLRECPLMFNGRKTGQVIKTWSNGVSAVSLQASQPVDHRCTF